MRNRDFATTDLLLRRLRSNLRITSHDLDDDLLSKLLAASGWAERFIGHIIIPSSFEETHTIGSSSILSLRLHGPLLSDPTVEADEAVEWKLDRRNLTLELKTPCTSDPEAPEEYEVRLKYRAGFDQIPDDIIHAVLIKASYLFDNPADSVEERSTASMNLLKSYRRHAGPEPRPRPRR